MTKSICSRSVAPRRCAAAVALGCLAPVAAFAHGATYSVADLGNPGNGSVWTEIYGSVNASGQAIATFDSPASVSLHRTLSGGTFSAASNLGGLSSNPGYSGSYTYSINDAGQVVGYSNGRAYRTEPNGVITADSDLGNLGGAGMTKAYGINASGQAVGYSVTASGVNRAFRTTPNGRITAASNLGAIGGAFGSSYAYAINASGQIVGDSGGHAFRTTATGTITAASDLGTLGGTTSYAYGVNDAGQVVGYSTTAAGDTHAYRTTATGVITAASDLGTLGGISKAYDISTAGQVVGTSNNRAFFVDVTGGMQDLNALIPAGSGWFLNGATGINDSGQISGYGSFNGQPRPFLLTLAPEPATAGLLAAGTALSLRRRQPPSSSRSNRFNDRTLVSVVGSALWAFPIRAKNGPPCGPYTTPLRSVADISGRHR